MKILILENIRSAYNVGAIFRTADGAGADKIYLVGYTPKPIDRFGRRQPEIDKTSLGASRELNWKSVASCEDIISQLKKDNFQIVAIEQAETSQSMLDFTEPDRVAYILGNEITGVEKCTLDKVDTIVEIPMLGYKESLNVSVSAGVVLYHGLKKT